MEPSHWLIHDRGFYPPGEQYFNDYDMTSSLFWDELQVCPSVEPGYFLDDEDFPFSTMGLSPTQFSSDLGSDSSSDNAFSTPNSTSTTTLPLPPSDEGNSGHDDDDDDYLPVSQSSPRRERPRKPAATSRRARSESPAPKASRKTPYPTTKRRRKPPPSRVHQVDGKLAEIMHEALEKAQAAIQLNFKCPDHLCRFSMKANPRMPDFRRHLKAHLREADSGERCHTCKGIPYSNFLELPEKRRLAISNDNGSSPYMHQGDMMIGGCLQSFSRGDALTRHIKSPTNACVGVVSGHLEGC